MSYSFSGRRKSDLLLSRLNWKMSCADVFSVVAQYLPRELEFWFQLEKLQIHISQNRKHSSYQAINYLR